MTAASLCLGRSQTKSLFLFSCVLFHKVFAFSGASSALNPFYDDSSDSYYDDGIDRGYDGECDSYDDSR